MDLRKSLVRRNGDGPSHRREADKVFRNLGTIYDYWYDTFGRKSYDGKGLLVAAINFDPSASGAGWDPTRTADRVRARASARRWTSSPTSSPTA